MGSESSIREKLLDAATESGALQYKISPKGTVERRAIPGPGTATAVVRALIADNQRRHVVASRLLSRLGSYRPYDPLKLEAEGLSWKHNFSTMVLRIMVSKVAPRLAELVQGVRYLTNSEMPPGVPDAARKTDVFRRVITELIRGHPDWSVFLDTLAMDTALFGSSVVGCLDEHAWFPEHFSYINTFLPDDTSQVVDRAVVVCIRERVRPHELYDKIRDPKAAAEAGWKIPEVIRIVNESLPKSWQEANSASVDVGAWYQLAERELSVGTSYTEGVRPVEIFSLFVRELTGKVSHYRVAGSGAGSDQVLLFSRDDRFDSMSDVFSFFSFEVGDGTMGSSQGVGRAIYNLAAAVERARNRLMDNLWLSGKRFFAGDPRQMNKFSMSVVGEACLIPNGWTLIGQPMNIDVSGALAADEFLSRQMEQLVGAVSSGVLRGERVTAAQVNLFAAREEEIRDSRATRFVSQIAQMVGLIQRRFISKDVRESKDPRIEKAYTMLRQVMSDEEIKLIASQPVAGTVMDFTPVQRQIIAQFAAEKRGHPLYDNAALEELDAIARVGADVARQVLLPSPDPTVLAEQKRQQDLEWLLLMAGQAVPVSPRDNHLVHLQAWGEKFQALGQPLAAGQIGTDVFSVVLEHGEQHYQLLDKNVIGSELYAQLGRIFAEARKVLVGLQQVDQQALQLGAQAQALDAEDVALAAGAAPAEGPVPAGQPAQAPVPAAPL